MEIRRFGNPSGKKVMLLHGNLMCWRQFEDVIPLLETVFDVYKDKLCTLFQKRVPDLAAPYDAYDESDDTEEAAKAGFLKGVGK